MKKFKFYNVKPSKDNKPPKPYNSFKDYWFNKTKTENRGCCRCGISGNFLDAYFVHKKSGCRDGKRREIFILLLCDDCPKESGYQLTKPLKNDPMVEVIGQKCECVKK